MQISLPNNDEESQLGTVSHSYAHTLGNIGDATDFNGNTMLSDKQTRSYQLLHYLAQFQFCRIPAWNWCIITLFLYMISKLIKNYESMYAESKLLTTITANSLLYGLSDTLAQSISCYIGNRTSESSSSEIESSVINLDNFHESDTMFTDYGDTSSLRRNSRSSLGGGSQYQILIKQTEIDIFNFRRFFGFIFWGFLMAFIQVAWYWVLNHFYTKEPTLVSVLERVLTDQLLFSPLSLFSFFSYSNFVLEGGDKFTLHQKIQRIYMSTLACNYMVWPLVQFINFLVMPKRFQVPFSSSSKF